MGRIAARQTGHGDAALTLGEPQKACLGIGAHRLYPPATASRQTRDRHKTHLRGLALVVHRSVPAVHPESPWLIRGCLDTDKPETRVDPSENLGTWRECSCKRVRPNDFSTAACKPRFCQRFPGLSRAGVNGCPIAHTGTEPCALPLGILPRGKLRGLDRTIQRDVTPKMGDQLWRANCTGWRQRRVPAGQGCTGLLKRARSHHQIKPPVNARVQAVDRRAKDQRPRMPCAAEAGRAFRAASRQGPCLWPAAPPMRAGPAQGSSGRCAPPFPDRAPLPVAAGSDVRSASPMARTCAGMGGIRPAQLGQGHEVEPGAPHDYRPLALFQHAGHVAQPVADRIGLMRADVAVEPVGKCCSSSAEGRPSTRASSHRPGSASALTITPP